MLQLVGGIVDWIGTGTGIVVETGIVIEIEIGIGIVAMVLSSRRR